MEAGEERSERGVRTRLRGKKYSSKNEEKLSSGKLRVNQTKNVLFLDSEHDPYNADQNVLI